MWVSLAGFEPTTTPLVKRVLYPLSYSETPAEGNCVTHSWLEEFSFLWMRIIHSMLWIDSIAFCYLVRVLQVLEESTDLMLRFKYFSQKVL